jgi:hypothetical protein
MPPKKALSEENPSERDFKANAATFEIIAKDYWPIYRQSSTFGVRFPTTPLKRRHKWANLISVALI